MAHNEVYFSNHGRALKFPWSLYHAPLIHSLNKFLKTNAVSGKSHLLVVGPGDLPEMQDLVTLGLKISVLDIDPRVIENLKLRFGDRIENFFLVGENFENYPQDSSFDLIYAKEVIEHFPRPIPFLEHLQRLLKRDGKIWMSTPNYGFFLLPFLESTVLELVARLSGFSRRDIHPSKFSQRSLEKAFTQTGFTIEACESTFAGLALWISAKKP